MKTETLKINLLINKQQLFMKTIKLLPALFLATLLFSCSDDDTPPAPVNEEEVITTMTITLQSPSGEEIELKTFDADGDGPNDPVVTVSGNLAAATIYTGTIELLNETESPAEDITEEISEEDLEHQFFFNVGGGLDCVATYAAAPGGFDSLGNPLGLTFNLTTSSAGSGTFTVTLRHEPTKPNDGTLSGAGGETDIETTFSITVE